MPMSSALSRDQALDARPLPVELESRQPTSTGARLTVRIPTPRWMRWILRAGPTQQRVYELDPMGLAVLDLCDGRRNVRDIIDAFAADHPQLPAAQARKAVTVFLRTLLERQLVVMEVQGE